MHIGHNNNNYLYSMLDTNLETTETERDLGVIIDRSLKPSKQCHKAAARAKVVPGQILKYFHFRDRNHFIRLYKTYVRPHLEFASAAWSPWTSGDIDILEKVQEKAIRNTAGLQGATYQEKCREVGLETLAERRNRQDMIQTFKILKGFDGVRSELLFERMSHTAGTRLAADPWNLKGKKSKKDVRAHSFSQRVVEKWNSLPAEIKSLNTPTAFKNTLRRMK
jgi:hypothetical protein